MSERVTDPQVVCPFVAFDDDRDFRSPVPDHRHRCFAESPAAPRALAHQAAYCLSSAFPGCPTFMDWARREAAPPKESPVRSLRGPGAVPRGAAGAPPPGRPPSEGQSSPGGDWTAPPPWAGAAPAAAGASAAAAGMASAAEGDEHEAGELATDGRAFPPPAVDGYAPPPRPAGADAPQAPVEGDAPPFLAGRSARPAPVPGGEPWDAGDAMPGDEVGGDVPARRPVTQPRRVPVGYAPVPPPTSDRGTGGSRAKDVAAPSWEQPRRLEAYPTLKSRGGGGLPRPALYALVILLVGAGLFAAPFLLRGLGGGESAGPTPSPSASVVPTVEPSPTPEPTPEQVVYTVKAGDTLSKIGAKYGVTVDQILAANPSIKNANQIAVGDQIVIPQPLPSEVVDGEITPAP